MRGGSDDSFNGSAAPVRVLSKVSQGKRRRGRPSKQQQALEEDEFEEEEDGVMEAKLSRKDVVHLKRLGQALWQATTEKRKEDVRLLLSQLRKVLAGRDPGSVSIELEDQCLGAEVLLEEGAQYERFRNYSLVMASRLEEAGVEGGAFINQLRVNVTSTHLLTDICDRVVQEMRPRDKLADCVQRVMAILGGATKKAEKAEKAKKAGPAVALAPNAGHSRLLVTASDGSDKRELRALIVKYGEESLLRSALKMVKISKSNESLAFRTTGRGRPALGYLGSKPTRKFLRLSFGPEFVVGGETADRLRNRGQADRLIRMIEERLIAFGASDSEEADVSPGGKDSDEPGLVRDALALVRYVATEGSLSLNIRPPSLRPSRVMKVRAFLGKKYPQFLDSDTSRIVGRDAAAVLQRLLERRREELADSDSQ